MCASVSSAYTPVHSSEDNAASLMHIITNTSKSTISLKWDVLCGVQSCMWHRMGMCSAVFNWWLAVDMGVLQTATLYSS
jgi:hypothetical protein